MRERKVETGMCLEGLEKGGDEEVVRWGNWASAHTRERRTPASSAARLSEMSGLRCVDRAVSSRSSCERACMSMGRHACRHACKTRLAMQHTHTIGNTLSTGTDCKAGCFSRGPTRDNSPLQCGTQDNPRL